jgi:hypothetical protein
MLPSPAARKICRVRPSSVLGLSSRNRSSGKRCGREEEEEEEEEAMEVAPGGMEGSRRLGFGE